MVEKKPERRGLGRGLAALMADVGAVRQAASTAGQDSRRPDLAVPLEALFPNPDQPRRDFDKVALDELAASIGTRGIIQPLIVRPRPGAPGTYEIVAGERRWRAAQLARLHEAPVIIRDFTDAEVLEVAIVENVQRADLNAVEEAMGYRQLIERFGHTQDQLAEALGKSRSHIANQLRLLQLPEEVQQFLRDGKLSAGHARALITTPDPVGLARQVIARGLSVRETERLAKAPAPVSGGKPKAPRPAKDADTRALEADLSASLGMRVRIEHIGHDGGHLTVTYRTLEQLDRICQMLNNTP